MSYFTDPIAALEEAEYLAKETTCVPFEENFDIYD